jgi:hypothetical protein
MGRDAAKTDWQEIIAEVRYGGPRHEVKSDVADWAKRSPKFAFDPSGSHLFSIMELAYSYAKRAHELIAAIERLLESGDLDWLEVRFMKFHAGQRDAQVGLVRVMDALRHLEEVDNAYFAHLESRHPALKALTDQVTAAMAAAPEMADRQLALRVSRSEKRTVWPGMVQCEAEGSRS